MDGLAVVIDDETSYLPDALVNCGEPVASDSLGAPHPVIVVQVLSPSTRDIDKSVKLADYFRVPCLSHYLIIDLGRHHVLHYPRQPDGAIMVALVKEGDIVFDAPKITVAVADLFG